MHINNIRVLARNTPEVSEYSIAEEKRLQGAPRQRLENHYSSPCEQFHTGMTKSKKGPGKIDNTNKDYNQNHERNKLSKKNQENRPEKHPRDNQLTPAGDRNSGQQKLPDSKTDGGNQHNRQKQNPHDVQQQQRGPGRNQVKPEESRTGPAKQRSQKPW
ncbi:hypothetical protein [Shewanella sp. 38A_GOM-205m]|uniref:hypothetical protein n=1 Tax=Shewanella sp. 38A_GOM-205m TaxID=1380363 RepID=UPI0006891093|nr:hypothetical protein [Shewanella sp. 38A_GOM-205m]